ncbi:MAG: DUF3536 domain-containing protein [Candidatus Hadarchaeota archaeon]
MSRYICIHGHFYQPPRENPWLEEIELEERARPYHDWNERITEECYAPNAASRILDSDRRIIDVMNNYSRISFDFGPTLLSWMEDHSPEVYESIIEADEESRKRFSGHGSAIAQAYNHMIMPLANSRDKRTQIRWGIRDFEYHFGRMPEGMWLPETAVDVETLDIMAEEGISFTILAPHQANRVRELGSESWNDVSNGNINTRRPYLCRLPSGGEMTVFFYNGSISKDVGFGGSLGDGRKFAEKLRGKFSDNAEDSQLVHFATDGETYGHHREYGDMALARCLYEIESGDYADMTVYGEYLERHPPEHEVEILEETSWSCEHGVDRWRRDCGCNTGKNPGWTQEWRGPLRDAMNWLRNSLVPIYEDRASKYLNDPWIARDDYVSLILERSEENLEDYFSRHSKRDISQEEKVQLLKLLEMQRNAMLMFTSCGWFFDDIAGEEGRQVLRYAARAMQLADEVAGVDLEPEYMNILREAPCNSDRCKNGKEEYERLVEPGIVDFYDLTAHYAIASLFEEYSDEQTVYSFKVGRNSYDLEQVGGQRLSIGEVSVMSNLTREERNMAFTVIHLGEHNIMSGVMDLAESDSFIDIQSELRTNFLRGNAAETIHIIDERFGEDNYSLWDLFPDEQRSVLKKIMEKRVLELEDILRDEYEEIHPMLRAIRGMNVSPPSFLVRVAELVTNANLKRIFREKDLDLERLEDVLEDTKIEDIQIDEEKLSFDAARRIERYMEELERSPFNLPLIERVDHLIDLLYSANVNLDLWKAQNYYFEIGKAYYDEMRKKAESGDGEAEKWIEGFDSLGRRLNVKFI